MHGVSIFHKLSLYKVFRSYALSKSNCLFSIISEGLMEFTIARYCAPLQGMLLFKN